MADRNATAEAEARGDDFNAPIFRRATLLKSGALTGADRDSDADVPVWRAAEGCAVYLGSHLCPTLSERKPSCSARHTIRLPNKNAPCYNARPKSSAAAINLMTAGNP